jgi:anti-sigma B factor antagonist
VARVAILEVSTERDGDAVHIALSGELDISSAERVESELAAAERLRPEVVVLDLRALEFMDSTGLRLMVSADARAREDGHRLVIVQGPEAVRRIFRITRLDERLEIVADPAAVA